MPLTFLDVLGWMKCPLAAKEGYEPEHPAGDPALAKEILDTYPKSRYALREVSDSSARAAEWLGRTRYGAARQVRPAPQPPPRAIEGKGFWRGDTGYLDLPTGRRLQFRVPHVHYIGEEASSDLPSGAGAWEIVALDTSASPPSVKRRADLGLWLSFLTTAFEKLTGHWARARIVAPGYESEWCPNIPQSRLDELLSVIEILGEIVFHRPGEHCYDTETDPDARGSRHMQWKCPLRRNGRCEFFAASSGSE